MPCFAPLHAWRNTEGTIQFNKARPTGVPLLQLPCTKCIGCQARRAQEWTLRNTLEATEHSATCWATLTYNDDTLQKEPWNLNRKHITQFHKRLRNYTNQYRHFTAGEYGEETTRPHYHTILYGLSTADKENIQKAWPYGFTRTDTLTTQAIAYVAGYTAKKLGRHHEQTGRETVNLATGEVYEYQAPFIQSSTKPHGIGGKYRDHWQSWRNTSIQNGYEKPVPRYYHKAYQDNAPIAEILMLEYEHQLKQEETQHQIETDPETYTKNLDTAWYIAMRKSETRKQQRKL